MSDFLKPYTLVAYLVAFLLALLGILLYGKQQYDKGHAVASAQAVLQVAAEREAERQRQAAANLVAQQQAQDDITRLLFDKEALNAKLKENTDAAATDPHAARECLGADSVRRLNAIR